MSTSKWLEVAVGICLVMIIAVVTAYSFESGSVESAIPVTGCPEIPLLCGSRAHGKIQPVVQPIHIDSGESVSPGS